MDIFNLGDKILDLLNVIFAFWNNQISVVFELLGQSPTTFKGGLSFFPCALRDFFASKSCRTIFRI